MAPVAFHIHVDNLVADAVNIVTLGLFLIPQRYFIATITVYIYIYIFSAPRQPPRYQQQSLTYPRGQVGFVHGWAWLARDDSSKSSESFLAGASDRPDPFFCRSLASLRIFPSTVSALVISDPSTVAAIFQWPILPLCSTSSLNSIFGTLPSGSSLAIESGNVPLTMPTSVPTLAKVAILESAPDTLISVSVLCRKGLEVSFK